MKTIGVLALQGDFDAHCAAIGRAGGKALPVRTALELRSCDGLVIPGGESTTMLKLLTLEKLFEPLRQFGSVKPIYGTCAGAILLAKGVSQPAQASLQLMDIDVERNAYGRQVDSRIVRLASPEVELEAVFIRAPIIRRVGAGVSVVASYNGDPVWVEDGRHLVTTFHPELCTDPVVHAHFVKMVERCASRPIAVPAQNTGQRPRPGMPYVPDASIPARPAQTAQTAQATR